MLLATSADFSTALITEEPGDLRSRHRGPPKVPVLLQHCLPAASLHSRAVRSQHREEVVQSQCKSQLWQPHSPPLAPIYFQSATHHKNQSYFSCCCYYKFRIQSTLHLASCRKLTLYVEKPVRHQAAARLAQTVLNCEQLRVLQFPLHLLSQPWGHNKSCSFQRSD